MLIAEQDDKDGGRHCAPPRTQEDKDGGEWWRQCAPPRTLSCSGNQNMTQQDKLLIIFDLKQVRFSVPCESYHQ